MSRIINAVILAVIAFVLLNFLYSNMDAQTLGYPMEFRFPVWGWFSLKSVPMPLGYVLIVAFGIGMIFFALVQTLPTLFRRREQRLQQRKIQQLEKEVEKLRAPSVATRVGGPKPSSLLPEKTQAASGPKPDVS